MAGPRDQIVLYLRPTTRNVKPITPSTVTMSQWMMRPIARFATTAIASTTATAIVANTTEPAQPRPCSTRVFDSDFGVDLAPDFVFAFVLVRAPLRGVREFCGIRDIRGEI